MILTLTAALLLWITLAVGRLHPAEPAQYQRLPSLREQAQIQDKWRDERLARIPSLLAEYNIDAWLISQREYAEDTLWWSMKGATEFAPHRRTVLLFYRQCDAHSALRWVDNTGDVWPALRATLVACTPARVALNTDPDIAFGGGLHAGELTVLYRELGDWMRHTVSEPMLGVELVAARVSDQLQYYRMMQETVWAMIEEAFSARVIHPEVTTTQDVEWWFCEQMRAMNVSTWSHPRVSVITPESFPGWSGTDDIIAPGDLLHVDFGISAMGMHTDTQHLAYVLRAGEHAAPQGLVEGLEKANRMQDIVLEKMHAGLTGNAVLSACLEQMAREGIEGQVYSHPIGDWAHSAGAVIGFTNLPEFVPVLGELPILANTYYSIELYAYHHVPERNETLRFRLEENAYWVDEVREWEFVRGRQERLHLVNWTYLDDGLTLLFQGSD